MTSIEDQLRAVRTYATAQGWTVDERRVYSDAGISGSSIDGRPGLQALMAAAAQQPRPFDVLLVDDSSRVARDLPDAIRLLQTLTFFGVRVVYVAQGIDSTNPQAEMLLAVHGLIDAEYLRGGAKKIKRGLAGQHARGFATGSITFGYRTVPVPDPSGKLDPDGRPVLLGKRVDVYPEQADAVRLIFEWYADGRGADTIRDRLNRDGQPGPRGRRWRAATVRSVLANEKYRGLLIWGRQRVERRPGTRQRVMRAVPRDHWHIQERPELRIVSDDLWSRAQARRAEVREAFGLRAGRSLVRGRSAAVHSPHLFSGLMRCGVCGGSVTVVSGGYGSPRYGCQRSWKGGRDACANRLTIRAKVADAALLAGLQAELLRPETVAYVTAALASQLNAVLDQRPALRQRAEDGLRDARRRLHNLVAAIETGESGPTLLEAIRSRETDVRRLQAELATLSEPLDQKLAVIPTWVRQQLADAAGLLTASPERTKLELKRLAVAFVLHPVAREGHRPFLRAEGTTEFAQVLAGQYSPASTTVATDLQHDARRTTRFVVNLPANQLGPGWRQRAAGDG